MRRTTIGVTSMVLATSGCVTMVVHAKLDDDPVDKQKAALVLAAEVVGGALRPPATGHR